MEYQKFTFPILFTFLLFVFMVLRIGKRSKTKSSLNLPPGPWKLPVIGNLHQFVGSLPHRTLRDLANKHGPLMYLQLGEVPTVVVSSPELAREVMKTHDSVFASRPTILASEIMSYGSADIVFARYGNYWRQLRKICVLELLSSKRVESFRPLREEELSNLTEWIASKAGSSINISDKLFSTMSVITARAAFGKKCKDQEKFLSAVLAVFKLAGGFDISDVFPTVKLLHLISGMGIKIRRAHRVADRALDSIINDHREAKAGTKSEKAASTEDLVDVLLNFQKHGDTGFSLSDDNIKAVILDMFSAGSETSATTLIWAMSEMIKDPSMMKKAQDEVREVFNKKGKIDETATNEMDYLKLVVKETLRLHPPAPLLVPRESREGCELNGYQIPDKTRVFVNAWAVGRDPKYWPEPERFNPERFIDNPVDYKGTYFEFIPFGAGRRMCPGMTFGLVSVEFALAMLLYHFDWKLPNGMKHEDLDMTETYGLTAKRKADLHLVPTPYYPLPVE